MTFLVPLALLLLKSCGMRAQVPMKSLFWLSRRQVQGNSPGLASPCFRPGAGLHWRLPHSLPPPPATTCSAQFCRQRPWVAACACSGVMQVRPNTDRFTSARQSCDFRKQFSFLKIFIAIIDCIFSRDLIFKNFRFGPGYGGAKERAGNAKCISTELMNYIFTCTCSIQYLGKSKEPPPRIKKLTGLTHMS